MAHKKTLAERITMGKDLVAGQEVEQNRCPRRSLGNRMHQEFERYDIPESDSVQYRHTHLSYSSTDSKCCSTKSCWWYLNSLGEFNDMHASCNAFPPSPVADVATPACHRY